MEKRIVKVTWQDAHGNAFAVYEPHEVPHQAALVFTFGVLLREDEAGISLANEMFEAGSFRGVTFIPRGMIVSVEDLHHQKPARKRKLVAAPSAPHEDTHSC